MTACKTRLASAFLATVALMVLFLTLASPALAQQGLSTTSLTGPSVGAREGTTVEDVSIESYGVVDANAVWRYLSVRKGVTLTQAGIDRDYANLVRLGGFRTRLTIASGNDINTTTLHWIVMAPWFTITIHPLYEEPPLSDPTRGVGFAVTSRSNVALVTSFNRFAQHALITFTSPIAVNPYAGRETDLLVSVLGERDAYRVSIPQAVTVYNWTSGGQVQYLRRGTAGTQFEIGLREERSTTNRSAGIIAPSVYPSDVAPARSTIAALGMSHACKPGPTGGWYAPFCHAQYRTFVADAIGGLGATSTFQFYAGDVAQYIPVRTSTLALHVAAARTGGVVPESRLVCIAALRGYPEPFCGTDGTLLQAEYRLNDASVQHLKFVLFTETGSFRVRGGNQPWEPPTFQWHADSGAGIRYRGLEVDVAHGSEGYRLNVGLSGQSF